MSSSAVEHACADLLDTASTSPSSSHSGAARKESCPVVHADDAAEVEGVLISSNSQSDNAYVTKKDDTNNDKKRTMTYAAASQCAMNSKPLKETGIHPVDGGGGNPTVAENIAPSPLPAPPLQQPSPSGGGYGSLEMQLAIAEGRIVKLSHENNELKNMLIFKDHELDSITAAYQLVSTENATLHATIEHNEMRHLHERTELYASLQHQEQQLSLLQQQCAQFQHKLSSTIASHSRSMSTDIIPQSSSASEDRVLTGDRSPSGLASEATFHKRIALLESEQRNTHKELHTAQETILELETELEGLRAERYAATRKPTSDVGVMADDSYLGTTIQDQMLISALQVLSSSSARPIQVKLHVDPDPMTHTLRQLIDVCETSELSDLINLPLLPWRPPGEEFTFQRDRQPMNWSDDLPSPLVRLMERKAAANEEEAGSVRVSGSTRLTAQQPPHHHPGSRSFSWGGEGLISSDATEFFGIRKQPPFLHAAPKNRAEVIALKK